MSFDNIWQWSETAASNTAIASTDITGATGKVKDGDNAIRALMSQIITMEGKGTDVASAGTVTLGTERYYHITGTTTITDIDFTDAVDGRWAWLIFDGALTLTHNATTLQLPGGANITTAAGDRALFVQDATDNVICLVYQRAAMEGKGTDVASAGTVTLGTERYYHITGTTTITDIDFTDAVDGRWAWLIFDGALTLTHNATTLQLPGGASITTAAGDRALFVQDATDNVICLSYVPAALVVNTLNGQYKFPATQNASSDANTLDDYEEGTWTPAMTFNSSSSGVVHSVQDGYYVKIGQTVFAYGRVTLTNNGSGVGSARITGLPFTSSNTSSGGQPPGSMRKIAGGSAATSIYPAPLNNSTSLILFISGAVSDAQATDTEVTNTFSADFSIVYRAAS